MYGSHTTRSVWRLQRTYEDQALVYRRQIEDLIQERQSYQEQFQELQPTFDDDGQRLSHLEATIRNIIPLLQQYTIDYNETVEKWQQLDADYEIVEHRYTNDWARTVYASAESFFAQPDLHPTTLDAQFVQLINDYRDLLDAVNEHDARFRFDPVTAAGFEREASTPATEAPSATPSAATVVNDQERRRTSLSPLLDSVRSEPRSGFGPLPIHDRGSPAQASQHSQDHHRVTFNDDARRHYYTDQSEASTTIGRSSFVTVDAYHAGTHSPSAKPPPATHRGIPIVQQLDHGDDRSLEHTFRNRFLDVVEGQRNLPPRYKLQYLLQFLRGEPYQLANNYQLTDENYFAVVDLLEERYGNVDMIRNLLMADLVALRPPSQAIADLRRFYGDAQRVTTELNQLGDNVDSNRLYEQTLMSKLPTQLKMELIRNSDYATQKTASSILKGLNNYILVLESVATTGTLWANLPTVNSGSTGRRTPPRPSSPRHISSARQAPHGGYGADAEDVPKADSRKEKRETCALCSQSHWAAQCTVYAPSPTDGVASKSWDIVSSASEETTGLRSALIGRRSRASIAGADSSIIALSAVKHQAGTGNEELRVTVQCAKKDHERPKSLVARPMAGSRANRAWYAASECRQRSDKANSKKIHRRKKSRSPGTGFKGRKGTSRPTTTSTAEDVSTKEVHACDLERRLAALEISFATARRPPTNDLPKFDRAQDRAGSAESWVQDPDADGRRHELRDEDESYPASVGHCSDASSNGPSDAEPDGNEWFPPYEEPTAFTVSASLPADTQTVLLECAKVIAVNPNNGTSREVTAFFDSGSNVTYVSTALALNLGLPQQGRRRLRVNTFGCTKPLDMEGFATNLVLRSRRGHSVSLKVTAAPDCIVKAVTTALVEDHELPSLLKNEVTLISSRETPDILIGQDTAQLFKRHTETRLPNGFDLIQTILGPVVGGAGRVANPEDVDTTSIVICAAPSDDVRPDHDAIELDGSAVQSTSFPPPPETSKFRETPLPTQHPGKLQKPPAAPGPLPESCLATLDEVTVKPRQAQTSLGPLPVSSLAAIEGDSVTSYFSGPVDKSDEQIFGDFSYL